MPRLRQAEGHAALPGDGVLDELLLLRFRAEITHHEYEGIVGHDGRFILKVVVEPKALRSKVLANHRHAEVGAILAAELLGQGITIVTSRIGAAAHLPEQLFPLMPGQTAVLEIGPGPFTPVIEEALVIVLRLQRLNLRLDELIEGF